MVRGQPSRLMGLETLDGWLIAGNTHDIFARENDGLLIFVLENKLILHGYIHI